jgi:hypothetical protein
METSPSPAGDRAGPVSRTAGGKARLCGRCLLRGFGLVAVLWTFGAVYFDGPFPGTVNLLLGILWLLLLGILLFRARTKSGRRIVFTGALALVILPWLFKRPSNDRDWAPEYARSANATVEGDAVTFTNFRNFNYALDGTVTERWETRTVHLSKLRGIDLILNYWGSEWIAHPIFSFDFGDEGHIAFSIETRREKGEVYTALGGLYKLYELTYLVGDERDFVRVRTNIRKDEDAYLYRLAATPENARKRFLEYVQQIQALSEKPRFYDVITANCTTAVSSQVERAKEGFPDWRLLLNGKLDEMFHDKDLFAAKGLPLEVLKERGHVDDRALQAHDDPAFSQKIREGVPTR